MTAAVEDCGNNTIGKCKLEEEVIEMKETSSKASSTSIFLCTIHGAEICMMISYQKDKLHSYHVDKGTHKMLGPTASWTRCKSHVAVDPCKNILGKSRLIIKHHLL